MFEYAILMISMLSSVSLYSGDTLLYQSSDAAEPAAAPTVTQDPDLFNKFEVSGFFGRQRKKKLLEGFEHCYTTDELVFLLATDPSAEPTINPCAFANAKTFVGGLQQAIAEQLTAEIGTPDDIRTTLYYMSKHARYICHACCELELKKRVEFKKQKKEDMDQDTIWTEYLLKAWSWLWERVGKEKKGDIDLGTLRAEHPLKIGPCSWERVDAATFYKACAYDTTFYSKKTDEQLSVLLAATK